MAQGLRGTETCCAGARDNLTRPLECWISHPTVVIINCCAQTTLDGYNVGKRYTLYTHAASKEGVVYC